jgi:hypothetical protein
MGLIVELPEFPSAVFGFGPRVKILNLFFNQIRGALFLSKRNPPIQNIALRLMPRQWTIPSGRLQYKNGKLEGMSATDVTQPATTILAVMYTSVLSKNKDVLGLFPVQNLTADYLSELIQKIIKDITFMGFEILTLISDNNKVNKKTFDILSDGNCRSTIINKYNNKPIFILFDTVHLFKSIRNNWLNQKDCEQTLQLPSFQEPVDDDDGTIGCLTAKMYHLRSLYFKEQAQVVKLAPAVNKKVLNPTGIQRQNVLLCVKLFDEKNISALRVKKDEFSNSAVGTISFMETISTWWKIVNCKTPFKGKHLRDVNCEPVYSVEDERFIFLQKFVIWLQRWNDMELKNIDKRHGKLTKQTQHALLHTTETLMLLCKFLFENYNFKYVCMYCQENFRPILWKGGLVNTDKCAVHHIMFPFRKC